ncbi:MAG: zinc-dependent alcohol dehydrogenase family protein [Solirubrobacteraceae bacterium]
MRAMVFQAVGEPLREVTLPVPKAGPGQLLIRVHACGVCRTDLHLLDGEVDVPSPPRVLGHQIVGTVVGRGDGAGSTASRVGDRVGVPWLGFTDGTCKFCRSGRENLCPNAKFTGRDIDGGYAQYTVADERFCFPIPDGYPDLQAAPLLCAGLIGYRCLRMCGDAERIGLYGFGASAHIISQVAKSQGRKVFAFTREGDAAGQQFARELGVDWAGDSSQTPPEPPDASIIFAPAGALVPTALAALEPGGIVVCGGIHMSPIPTFDYDLLWHERRIGSVANLTRRDGEEFLELAPRVPVRTHINTYPLEAANDALEDLRAGRFRGAAVLTSAAAP